MPPHLKCAVGDEVEPPEQDDEDTEPPPQQTVATDADLVMQQIARACNASGEAWLTDSDATKGSMEAATDGLVGHHPIHGRSSFASHTVIASLFHNGGPLVRVRQTPSGAFQEVRDTPSNDVHGFFSRAWL